MLGISSKLKFHRIIHSCKWRALSITTTSMSTEVAKAKVTKSGSSSKNNIFLDLASLSKLRLTSLVSFTTAAGFMCSGMHLDVLTLASACIGTSLCAGSASTFNQVFEKRQDANMKRTSTRPLPSGRITIPSAVSFGLTTGAAGAMILYLGTNPIVAALGSIVGAIPPVMGYAAATQGVILAPEPVILASILFLWQFPHFFALSWLHRVDYALGGFQMVPVNDPSGSRTANLIQEYTWYLTALPIATSLLGMTSYMFAIEGTMANMYLLRLVYKFKKDKSNANARKIFLCSLWYLPVLLIGYVFHAKSTNEIIAESNSTLEVNSITSIITDTDPNTLLDTYSISTDNGSSGSDTKNTPPITSSHINVFEQFKAYSKTLFKQLCIHEVIAYWNVNKKNSENDSNSVTANNFNQDLKGKLTTDVHNNESKSTICMKIKSEQAIHTIRDSATSKAVDITNLVTDTVTVEETNVKTVVSATLSDDNENKNE